MTTPFPSAPRSMLFMPGDRPGMAAKIPAIGPDLAVLDLEDAIVAGAKPDARKQVAATLADPALRTGNVLVRVNEVGSPWFADDLAAVAALGGVGVVLPKCERVEDVERVRARLPHALFVIGIESVRGVANARSLLAAGVDGAFFGAEDFIADIGGRRTAEGLEVLAARSEVVLAARLAERFALDQVVVAVHDDQAFRLDAGRARDLGYTGKLCLHPSQVALAHEVFSPSPEEIEHARRVLEAGAGGLGVLDGAMVDEVHLRQARTLLARAGEEA